MAHLPVQMVGITAALLLSGTYFSSSTMTVPILYTRAPAISTPIFSEFYYRGAAVVAPLSIVGAGCSAYLAWAVPEQRMQYALAASLTLAPLPWTQIVMQSSAIKPLLNIASSDAVREKANMAEVVTLLKRWTALNFVRSAFALAGGGLALWALSQQVTASSLKKNV